MISIIRESDKIEQLAKEYLIEVKSYFNIPKNNKLKILCKNKRSLEFKMIKYLNDNLEEIILCTPSDLKSRHNSFITALKLNLQQDRQHRKQFTAFKERMENYYSRLLSKMIIKDQEEISIGR